MPKFSAYMKGADGSMGPPGASIIDGVLANENMLPVPNQNKHAFLVGTTTPKHLWVWNENNPNENKWEDQGATASILEEVSASVTTIPWTTTAIPSITTQFSTSNQLDYINFDFTIPEGQPAGFGEVSITTQRLSYTTHPTASISTDGDNWSKNFHFDLGIPEGTPGGFSTYQPTSVSTLEWDSSATVEVINITTTPNDSKSFNFKFGIPQGRAGGFSTFSANIESVGWTEDPTVSISESGPNWGKNIKFDFKVPKTRPAGFGTSSDATAVTTAWDTQPQISVSTDGEDWEKNFHFGFEIPVGRPAGFGDINVTTSTLEANSNPWVKVNSVTDSPEYEKDFNFEFGLPKGIAAGFSTGQYVSVSTLDTGEQAVVEITTITTSPETAKEFNFHFGLPRGDALAIYDGITFTSTEDGIDYHWKYEQGTTTLVFNRGTVSKLPIYIYNDNNRSIASTFKISTSTIEYNADEPFDGTMYLMMPVTLQEVEVGIVSSTTYGYEPVVSRSTGSTSTKVILDFVIPEGKAGEADTIFKTASGNIISFTDGIEAPIIDLKVNIEPVQDLHGYDNPWPAGGGANIWNEEWELGTIDNETGLPGSVNENWRCKNFISVIPNESYFLYKGASYNIRYYWYDENYNFISSDYTTTATILTAPSNAHYIKIRSTANYTTYDNNISINYPSTITTYQPYSNICPISGWTGMTVQRTGKNLLKNNSGEGTTINGITWSKNSDGSINLSGTATNVTDVYINNSSPKQLIAKGTVDLVCSVQANYNPIIEGLNFQNDIYVDGVYVKTIQKSMPTFRYSGGNISVGTSRLRIASGTVIPNNTVYFPAIEIGTIISETYEPYTASTYPISWQTEAGTVYGGSLDVTTGVLTVDRALVTFENLTFNQQWATDGNITTAYAFLPYQGKNNTDDYRTSINAINNFSKWYPYDTSYKGLPSLWSIRNNNEYPTAFTVANFTSNPNTRIVIKDNQCSTITEYREKYNNSNYYVVYELATPQTYQLTPTEVTTLLGLNHLWADTGDSNLIYFKNSSDGTSAGIALSNINSNIDKKSNIGHIHDDRYYTESEINTFLANKVDNIDLNKILASMGLIYYNDKLYVNPDQGV